MIRRYLYFLVVLNVILLGVAVALWQWPTHRVSQQPLTDTLKTVPETVRVSSAVKIENQPVIVANTPDSNHSNRAVPESGKEASADLSQMAKNHPFYHEAAKVLSGKLAEKDAENRRVILNYCEHLRTSYTTKDIDFIRQVMSDKALIIVGNVVRTATSAVEGDERVTLSLKTKAEYLSRLETVFAANKKIDVAFSDFRVMRHPTMEGIYGVILRQKYTSDRYADDGWLFLLWDFRNPSMPMIHVRTWQPYKSVDDEAELIGINDFNLE